MRKQIAVLLKQSAEECALHFSNPARARNYNNERFNIHSMIPLSENTACVLFKKVPGSKLSAFFFYCIKADSSEAYWQYFCPTDSHILGMVNYKKYKDNVEKENFQFNF